MIYKRPPIQEAVIEIRFTTNVSPEKLVEVEKDNAPNYPLPPIPNAMLDIEMQNGGLRVEQRLVGFILTGPNGDEKQTIGPNNFSVSIIGSYPGWEKFVERFKRDKQIWERRCGRLTPARLGIRFVNRLDVPARPDEEVDWATYLNTIFQIPDKMRSKTNELQMRYVGGPLGVGQWQLTLSVAKAQPAILNHQSIVLDIDIGSTQITKVDESLYELLKEGHDLKNSFFESSITDAARELFKK